MASTSAPQVIQLPAGKSPAQMKSLINDLNKMRSEQRAIGTKLTEIEGDLNEHRIVLEALKAVDPERKCFRMVGGVLIEKKVKDIIPDLEKNYNLIQKTVETYQAKFQEKGSQINEHVKTNNLGALLRSTNDSESASTGSQTAKTSSKPSTSVLV
ncbi:hypothetical protein RDWZM_002843 [Blomia tropicalis]|uniref:Prefoldin subunit 2 n=1 Tax=Blomia tropicalis TaxID=40697 RepID=A0A9Q0MDI9_BLOTA|nr:Prefoldin subunit 2 [Blomia tropicalis]KAJ6224298.1 hypothetical protein RDWZM_002843 [Blomia tropicalis]